MQFNPQTMIQQGSYCACPQIMAQQATAPTLSTSQMSATDVAQIQNGIFPQQQASSTLMQNQQMNPLMMMFQITSSLLSMMSMLTQFLMTQVSAQLSNGGNANLSSLSSLADLSGLDSSSGSLESSLSGASDGSSSSSSSSSQNVSSGLANPTSSKKPLVVIEGDSLSTSTGGSYSYADQLGKSASERYNFSFQATGGDQIGRQIKGDIDTVNGLYDAENKDNVVVLWGGTNDLHSGKSAEETFKNLQETAQSYKDKGFKVVVLTSIQLDGKNDSTAEDTERKKFNDLIRNSKNGNNAPWASIVDVASLPEFSDTNNGVGDSGPYYSSDGVHLTQKGYKLISEQVDQALQALLGV